ncbi:MAG: ABC transporter substrate-binding protein [Bacillota bacterium]
MRVKTALVVILALAVVGVSFSGCAKKEAEIKVGLNVELTGSIPAVGNSCREAALMAVEEVNAAGGLEVGGQKYKVSLSVEDNEDKAESAAAAAQKLINQNQVVVMIGPNASRNAVPAAQVAESAKTPMISPWSTAVATTQGKKYVFRACFIDDFQGVVCAKFALKSLGATKAAVLYDIASEYNKGIAEVFRRTFEAEGGTIVAYESYTTGDKDFSSQLTKIKAAEPEVLFLPNYYQEIPLQIQQAKKLGYTGKFLGSDSWGFADLLKLGGQDVEGCFFSTHYAPDIATPEARKFIEAYKAKYQKTPDDVAALTYDSFGLFFQAIKAAGKVDREALREALANLKQYKGVTGQLEFRGTGDPVKTAVIIQIKGGQFTYYETASP